MLRRILAIGRFEFMVQRRGWIFWLIMLGPWLIITPFVAIHLQSVSLEKINSFSKFLVAVASVLGILHDLDQHLWSGFCARITILYPLIPIMFLTVMMAPDALNRLIRYRLEETFRTKPYRDVEYVLGIYLATIGPGILSLLLCATAGLGLDIVAGEAPRSYFIYGHLLAMGFARIAVLAALALCLSSFFSTMLIPSFLFVVLVVGCSLILTQSYGMSDLLGVTVYQNLFTQTDGFIKSLPAMYIRLIPLILMIPALLAVTVVNRARYLFRYTADLGEDLSNKYRFFRRLLSPKRKTLAVSKTTAFRSFNAVWISLSLICFLAAGVAVQLIRTRQHQVETYWETVDLEKILARTIAGSEPQFSVNHYDIRFLSPPHTGILSFEAALEIENRAVTPLAVVDLSLNPFFVVTKILDDVQKPVAFCRSYSLLRAQLDPTLAQGEVTTIRIFYRADFPAYISPSSDFIFNYRGLFSKFGPIGTDRDDFILQNPNIILTGRAKGNFSGFKERGILTLDDRWYPTPGFDRGETEFEAYHPGFSTATLRIPKTDQGTIRYWVSNLQLPSADTDDSYRFETKTPVRELALVWGDYQETIGKVGSFSVRWLHLQNHQALISSIGRFFGRGYNENFLLPGPLPAESPLIVEWTFLDRNRRMPPVIIPESYFRKRWTLGALPVEVYSQVLDNSGWAMDYIVNPILWTSFYDNLKFTGAGSAVLSRALFSYLIMPWHKGTYKDPKMISALRDITISTYNSTNPDLLGMYRLKCSQFHYAMEYYLGAEKYLAIIRSFWEQHRYSTVSLENFIEHIKANVEHPLLEDIITMLVYEKGILSYAIGSCTAEKVEEKYRTTMVFINNGEFELPAPVTLKCLSGDEKWEIALHRGETQTKIVTTKSKPIELTIDPDGMTPNIGQGYQLMSTYVQIKE